MRKTEEKYSADDGIQYLNTRFGKIRINLTKKISFPAGLLGMEGFKNYCLANFPNEKYKEFKILQSIDHEELAFVVLPIDNISSKYAGILPDIELKNLSKLIAAKHEDLAYLLITTVNKNPSSNMPIITVNVRAPLVVNTVTNQGFQHVFYNEELSIDHQIEV